jgi:hypothetical protein
MDSFPVEIISPSEKDLLLDKIIFSDKGIERKLYDKKASIHGMCIEIITDIGEFKETWEDNFMSMGDEIRPHGRVVAVSLDGYEKNKAFYEPVSKTSFIINCDYYGYVKSVALAVAADFLEDYHSIHRRFSIHGSCIDFDGRGIVIIAPSGTGKTTHSFGMLLHKDACLVGDDWIFVKLTPKPVAYASERNSYIRSDIGEDFGAFKKLVERTKLDGRNRGVADVEDAVGPYRTRRSSIIKATVILKRDKNDPALVKQITPDEAISYLAEHNFCNPYQLVKDSRKTRMRAQFFKSFLSETKIYMVNTIATIEETQKEMQKIAENL